MKVHLKALGCRLNEAELEQWSQGFQGLGHRIVNHAAEADVVVLNTCAVTQEASAKSRRLLNRLYRENPASRLVVSGCYATLQADEVAANLGVDLIVPNTHKDALPQLVSETFAVPSMPTVATEPGEASLFLRGRQRAFIKIQDGCRYRCTFCIVTVARGEERSRPVADIIAEINQLTMQGVQEIVLTGVHVGGYGSDLPNTSLYTLVKQILAECDVPRIRFASVEPWDLPEAFFNLFEDSRVMPHMHLPIQSGTDSVLRRMARRCKTTEFYQLVQYARQTIPDFNVTTDIIVGFPGETEQEWADTLAFVERIGFGHIHIFSYSPRAGTKAATLPNPVDSVTKKVRHQQLHALAEQQKVLWLNQQLGKAPSILWEYARSEAGLQIHTGYTPNYCKVVAIRHDKRILENTITPIQLTQVDTEQGVLCGEWL